MKIQLLSVLTVLSAFCGFAAEEVKTEMVPTVAVLPFEARTRSGSQNEDGKSIAELLNIELLKLKEIELVERVELEKAMNELQLSALNLVSKESQTKLGKLIGAKILITGSSFRSGDKNFLVAKVIGTETSRVLGCSVSGSGDFASLTPELARQVSGILLKSGSKLLPAKESEKSVLDTLSAVVKGNSRKVYVKVPENIQVSIPDPAAETELKKLLLGLGFQVVENRDEADFSVMGEAIASQAGSYQKFISAQARLEMSIYDQKKKLLAAGAVKETLAGVTYVIAAKDAIGQATLRLAAELFPVMK
ncbi:MAG: Curli production assembly/transport component CsgG [Lentisphaerae bacterium ADurb.Bin242]|nr:MAG: Curli production assembly/transport component CsgG [Lentisphaerae bacterium ADurb.Bin242]